MSNYNLDGWMPYVDLSALLRELQSWYGLPSVLEQQLSGYKPDGNEWLPLPSADWSRAHKAAVDYARQSVARYKNPYHNSKHFRNTEEKGVAATRIYLKSSNCPRDPAETILQAVAFALHLHDCHHCGATFRADAKNGTFGPYGNSTSQELVSGTEAVKLGIKYGLSPYALLLVMYIIAASTYGGATPRGRQLGIPDTNPRSVWGWLMRAPDVIPPQDFMDGVKQGIAVNYGEVPAVAPPLTWQGFIDDRIGFLKGYVLHCCGELDRYAGVGLSNQLGWRSRVQAHIAKVEGLRSRDSANANVRMIEAELQKYGVVLT